MTIVRRGPHDHNFKNLFLDFPEASLRWLLPSVLKTWGPVRHVEFVRQEPKKRNLSDRGLVLDLPILFTFGKRQLLLWLVESQEDKTKFSIYKLLRYTTDFMEGYPKASVIPAVLFDKYVDFIDLYARIDPTERENLYREFSEKEDTAMLAQYIKDKGRQEGRKESLFSIVRNAKKTGAPGRNDFQDRRVGRRRDKKNIESRRFRCAFAPSGFGPGTLNPSSIDEFKELL